MLRQTKRPSEAPPLDGPGTDAPLRPGAIRLRGVSRRFRVVHERNLSLKETVLRRKRVRSTEFWALRDVDLDITPGESVGVIGRNGAGKSTMLKLVADILSPSSGTVETAGTIASMLELGAGFHPDFTGRENVFLNASILGIPEREIARRFDEIVSFAELEEFIDSPVRTYSSGMQMRLAFSVASHVRADILLLDEVFAVGDASFQRKCLGRMFDFRRHGGTILFVSHDAGAIDQICERALLIDHGRIVDDGPPQRVLGDYNRLLTDEERPGTATGPTGGDERVSGSGEVEITGVRLTAAEGRPSEAFQTGDPFAVEIDFEVREPVEGLNFWVAVKSVDGSLCYATDLGRDGFGLTAGLPTGTMRCVVPTLHLHSGRFSVDAGVGSEDGSRVYRSLERWVEFSVFPRGRGSGLVDLAAHWEVARTAVGGPSAG